MPPPAGLDEPIHLCTDEAVLVDGDALASLPRRERSLEIVCASGNRYTACWSGVELFDVLGLGSVPPETTHVAVESADGYRVCVEITRALDGLLAFARDGDPLEEIRFVAPEIGGSHAVKAVRLVECLTLSPGEDRELHEELWPGE